MREARGGDRHGERAIIALLKKPVDPVRERRRQAKRPPCCSIWQAAAIPRHTPETLTTVLPFSPFVRATQHSPILIRNRCIYFLSICERSQSLAWRLYNR